VTSDSVEHVKILCPLRGQSSLKVTGRSGVTDHSPRRQLTRVPSASRAAACPSGGSPHRVASTPQTLEALPRLVDRFVELPGRDPIEIASRALQLAAGDPPDAVRYGLRVVQAIRTRETVIRGPGEPVPRQLAANRGRTGHRNGGRGLLARARSGSAYLDTSSLRHVRLFPGT